MDKWLFVCFVCLCVDVVIVEWGGGVRFCWVGFCICSGCNNNCNVWIVREGGGFIVVLVVVRLMSSYVVMFVFCVVCVVFVFGFLFFVFLCIEFLILFVLVLILCVVILCEIVERWIGINFVRSFIYLVWEVCL